MGKRERERGKKKERERGRGIERERGVVGTKERESDKEKRDIQMVIDRERKEKDG